jgi:hypothetical protein
MRLTRRTGQTRRSGSKPAAAQRESVDVGIVPGMDEPTTATARLIEKREHAAAALARVDEIEAQARAASQALATASTALVEFERADDGPPAERRRLEKALADAKITAAEPWVERAEGARRRARDGDQAVRSFTVEHLSELVAALEADGAAAASRLNAACEALVAAYGERESVARQIAAVVGQSGGMRPGDVSGSSADGLAREAQRLIQAGGEQGPMLRRDRYPRLVEQDLIETEHAVA